MPKKILVVEDDPDVLKYLVTLLEDSGYQVFSAIDGEIGYKVLVEEKPDLVTLDLQMPKETGTRFYRKLSRDKDTKNIPVIVISGLSGRHLAVKDPVAVFDKPIDKDELLSAIRNTLGE
jgi:DNA-binding response OmpR family regulator